MYSGSDSAESQTQPQWAPNPSTFNMQNDQVDWAALAQQWIIMKEAGPPPVMGEKKEAPPNEGGEAPMDVVENEKDDSEWSQQASWNWNAQSQSWAWNSTWTGPPGAPPPPVPLKPPLLPTPNYNSYTAPPDSASDNANFGGGTNNSGGYWNAGGPKQIKPHNRRYSKVNVPRPAQQTSSELPSLDANKRKQLPAWIREGLEKMERDKVKQIEREKEKQERDEYNEKLKENEKETMEILKSTIREQQRSKYESDGDSDDDQSQQRKSRRQTQEPITMTPEEQMMNVRRRMTEILLKVTNREIETICREEIQRHIKKNKASDQRVAATSGTNLSGRLGLGIYGGESGSSSEDDSDVIETKNSDDELKESIRRKKSDFLKTEKEIESKLADAESRKQNTSRTPSPDSNDNDTQVDAKVPAKTKRKSRSRSSSSDSSSRKRSSTSSSDKVKKKSRSPRRRSNSKRKYSRRSRSRSRDRRSRSSPYRRRRSRTRSRSRSRRSRSRSRGRSRRSRSSSSGRGKRSRRR